MAAAAAKDVLLEGMNVVVINKFLGYKEGRVVQNIKHNPLL